MSFRILTLFFMLFSFSAHALTVTEKEVSAAIKKEFVEQGIDEDIDLEFFGGQTVFNIEKAEEAKLLVSNLKTDEQQNKFSVHVEVFADGNLEAKTDIQGKFYTLLEVWVPASAINKDEIITQNKLKSIKVRSNRIKPFNIIDKEQLINAEAKRILKEGRVISDKEIGKKVLIKKGNIVTVIYKTDAMQITAKAEALANASRGDKLELMNVKSKKVLYGTVVDEDVVEIETGF